MTKKTNSLLCRFGLSTFWKNKCVINKKVPNILQLENIFYKELLNKKLDILIIQHNRNKITLFVYNQLHLNENYSNQIVQYYKKSLSISKTVEKFSVTKKFLILLIQKNKNAPYKKNKPSICIIKLFSNKHFFNKLRFLLKNLIIFKVLYFNKARLYLKFFQLLKLNTTEKNRKSQIGNEQTRKKLFKINGFIKLHLFSIFLENIYFSRIRQSIRVCFTNILLSKGFYKFSKPVIISTKYIKWDYRNLLVTVFLGSTYNKSKILADYIAQSLTKQKNHRKVLKFFVEFLEIFYFLNLIRFLGIQIRVNGKLGGKMRKSQYQYRLGKMQLQTLKYYLNYSLTLAYSKFGILSIKIWLVSGQKKL